jgi:ribosomal protein S18 acetylase RimI-like enzyme
MSIEIREAHLEHAADAAGFLAVLDSYAASVTGGGQPLDADVRRRLVPALLEQPGALLLLALSDGQVVGIASCFFGFSTFSARPLLNVHDLAVLPQFQGRGIGRALLAGAEARALARGCGKLTLEVLESNAGARRLYHELGFRDFELAGVAQRTFFLTKALAPRAD